MLKPSTVSTGLQKSDTFSEGRTSHSAYLNRHQTHPVRCLERKFAQFQGGIDVDRLEPFQIVKYVDNQQVIYALMSTETVDSLVLFLINVKFEILLAKKRSLRRECAIHSR